MPFGVTGTEELVGAEAGDIVKDCVALSAFLHEVGWQGKKLFRNIAVVNSMQLNAVEDSLFYIAGCGFCFMGSSVCERVFPMFTIYSTRILLRSAIAAEATFPELSTARMIMFFLTSFPYRVLRP